MTTLTKTQQELLNKIENVINVLKKYNGFDEFYNNSKNEQHTFTTGWDCNYMYNTAEKLKQKDLEYYLKQKEDYENCVNNNIVLVFAKTETINKLVKLGYIEVVIPAKYRGGAEWVKLLKVRA